MRVKNVVWFFLGLLLVFLMSGCSLVTTSGLGSLSSNNEVVEFTPDPTPQPTLEPTIEPTHTPDIPSPTPEIADPIVTDPIDDPIDNTPQPTPGQDKPMIALTFDDGPKPAVTEKVLDLLAENDAKATFFVQGMWAEKYPETIKKIHEAGCEIGSHTYDHKNLTKLNEQEIMEQLNQVDEILEENIGITTQILRPPYGSINQSVRDTVPVPMILWCIDTEDWKSRDPEMIFGQIEGKVKDGDIILMHDIYSTTLEACETVIPYLVEQGYELVTVSELFESKGISLEAGSAYRKAR